MNAQEVITDIVIIGGGIAGLWLLNRLRQAGYSAILLESGELGGGQSNKAQGIIHGGMKYALQGKLTPAAQAIAAMPARWKLCLEKKGEIDLSRVPILSQQQYLFSHQLLTGKIAGFFANMTLNSAIKTLCKENFPAIFQDNAFQGKVYALDELVIDANAVLRELAQAQKAFIFKINTIKSDDLVLNKNKDEWLSLFIQEGDSPRIELKAQQFIFTAGIGNELILKKLNQSNQSNQNQQNQINAQRRPLHMVMVKHSFDYPVYAHELGLSATPKITITTHHTADRQFVWYIGGQIAEDGVKLNSQEQIERAKKALKKSFSWLDFSTAQFASFYIDRAEQAQEGGARPDTCCVKEIENRMIAWPTKFAFAPLLADTILQKLIDKKIQPQENLIHLTALEHWRTPTVAKPIWEQLFI